MVQPVYSGTTLKFQSGEWKTTSTRVVHEASVSLTVNGEVWLTLMCSPIDLEYLAVGFIANEGLIHSGAEIASVRACPSGDNVDIWLTHSVERPQHWRRTSGCSSGMTSTSLAAQRPFLPVEHPLPPEAILDLMGQLYRSQTLYRETGGVHTSAISDGKTILLLAEDVGRHNTLDKLAGLMLLNPIKADPLVLLTTGRISSEMLQKAARSGVCIVASRSSPTGLSIELAESWNITLVGYVRTDQLTIYTHPENLITPSQIELLLPEAIQDHVAVGD